MSFPRYAAYKDSGVEWLGEVPEGWGVVPLKWYSSCKSGDSITSTNTEQQIDELNTVPAIGGNGVMGFTSKSNIETPILVVGRVGALCGNVHHIKPPAWISDNALILSISASFSLRYLCLTLFSRNLNDIASKTAQPLITGTQVTEQRIPFPPIQEQTTIAAFLDNETAKIDNLINEQKKLIELLKEKRQAVISTAVTKGLNPHAPMKDSGVEWLGEVPIGWEVVPLKNIIAFIESGTSVNSIDTPAESNEFGVLKTSCVYRGFFEPNENKAVLIDEYERVSCPLRENALIVSRMNTPDLVGAAGLVISAQKNIFLPDRLWQVAFSSASPNFVHFWTLSCFYRLQVQMACSGTSSSMQNLGQDQFRSFIFVNPPLNEQVRIAAFLDQETAKIDNLIQQAQKASTLLQERRTALISAAVTGKIDVRGFVTTNTTANCVGK